ncbi:MAG: O-acetyl-ADP-ribose deacetylase [Candidatus Abyssobacteria bacterium SURF_17]|uniref:O-acetyl-ADP-ribose deacetylase n=1 Tax=Candidatus Abyssobacteria bacterium SURF_17 TaxID=2093361 RepID=A0A419F2W6_9BACT|nr:MAG: O-acetyl-ADP-ribose deacetylase [Candidatus Abyssubacteria bacterium SURF_17]
MALQVAPTGMLCEPIEKKVGNAVVRLQHGDLTALPVDAFVFYAREDLQIGSGYGTAIQTRGGASVKKELDTIGRIKMGGAVITGAGEMKARHIVHACGPKFQEPDIEKKLRQCVQSALAVADKAGIKTLAFPPMGTGFYGVPLDLCANTMLDCIKSFLQTVECLEEVIICVIDYRDYVPFRKKMESM